MWLLDYSASCWRYWIYWDMSILITTAMLLLPILCQLVFFNSVCNPSLFCSVFAMKYFRLECIIRNEPVITIKTHVICIYIIQSSIHIILCITNFSNTFLQKKILSGVHFIALIIHVFALEYSIVDEIVILFYLIYFYQTRKWYYASGCMCATIDLSDDELGTCLLNPSEWCTGDFTHTAVFISQILPNEFMPFISSSKLSCPNLTLCVL